jgi:hypothetical protein
MARVYGAWNDHQRGDALVRDGGSVSAGVKVSRRRGNTRHAHRRRGPRGGGGCQSTRAERVLRSQGPRSRDRRSCCSTEAMVALRETTAPRRSALHGCMVSRAWTRRESCCGATRWALNSPSSPRLVTNGWIELWLAFRPLPFIPYDRCEDALPSKVSGATMHTRSLESSPWDRAEAARIPIEKTKAQLLRLGHREIRAGHRPRWLDKSSTSSVGQVVATKSQDIEHFFLIIEWN